MTIGLGRIMVVQEVVDRIEKAALFAKPPGKYAAANREAKGVVYLALVVLGCRDREGRKVEELIARLERGESVFSRFPVFPFSRFCIVGFLWYGERESELTGGWGIISEA